MPGDDNQEPMMDTHLDDAKAAFGEPGADTKTQQDDTKSQQDDTQQKSSGIMQDAFGTQFAKDDDKQSKDDDRSKDSKKDVVTDDDLKEPAKDSPDRAGWDKLKTIKDEAVNRVKELEAQLESRKDDPTTESLRARVKELEEENGRYSSRLKEVDFQSHPEYFNKYEKPIETAKAELASLAKSEDLEVNVDALFELRGKDFAGKVTEIIDELTRFNGDEFSRVAREAMRIIGERDAVAQDSESFMKEANERTQAEIRATFDTVSKGYIEALPQIQVPDGATDEQKADITNYNQELTGAIQKAEQLAFGQMDHAQVSEMAHKAAFYDFMMKVGIPRLSNMADSQIAALTAEIEGIKGAGPGITLNSDNSSGAKTMDDMDHMEAARATFANLP